MQHDKPVAFYSRKMTDPERNYVNHEQELLAAISALKVFRCYLLGNHFDLITDNKPNTYLDTQPTLSRRQARWSEYLQRFHFTWVHKPGKFNVADPLSRNPSYKAASAVLAVTTRKRSKAAATETETTETEQPALAAKRPRLAEPEPDAESSPDIAHRIVAAYSADPTFTDEKHTKHWSLHEGLWWSADQIVVPDDREVKTLIFRKFHDASYAGHLGVRKL